MVPLPFNTQYSRIDQLKQCIFAGKCTLGFGVFSELPMESLSSRCVDCSTHPSQNRTYRFPISGSSTRHRAIYKQSGASMALLGHAYPLFYKAFPTECIPTGFAGINIYAMFLSDVDKTLGYLGSYPLLRNNCNVLLIGVLCRNNRKLTNWSGSLFLVMV
jgi:hypothetical protein